MSSTLRQESETHFERGNALDESGRREAAIAEWQQAVRIDPEHAGAHYNLGIAHADNGELALAVSELKEALRLDPFDIDARRELADILVEQEQFDQAISQLRQALTINPSDGEIAHKLASLYLDMHRWDQAAGALDSGALLPEDAELFYRLGQAYQQELRESDAILAYRRALVCQPGHPLANRALETLHVPPEEPTDQQEDEEAQK